MHRSLGEEKIVIGATSFTFLNFAANLFACILPFALRGLL